MNTRHLARLTLGLAAALALVVGFALTAGAEDGGGVSPNNKCCKPASPNPPASSSCPAPPCADSVFCTPFSGTGSWSPGDCSTKEQQNCLIATGPLRKPLLTCNTLPCTKLDGTAGKTCGWVLAGLSNETQDVQSCNGDLCTK